jgi:hypothetical protein
MATTIAQALLDRFASSGVDDFAATGGLWLEEVPAKVAQTLPLFGFTHGGESCEYSFEEAYKEIGSFEFTIYALGIAEAERLGLAVKAVYDPCIKAPSLLSITNARVIDFERTGGQVGSEGFHEASGKQVGRVSLTYSYIVQRSLPT